MRPASLECPVVPARCQQSCCSALRDRHWVSCLSCPWTLCCSSLDGRELFFARGAGPALLFLLPQILRTKYALRIFPYTFQLSPYTLQLFRILYSYFVYGSVRYAFLSVYHGCSRPHIASTFASFISSSVLPTQRRVQ